jgi:hypothetical protein
MLFYVRLIERECRDPQECRAMARIRQRSIAWLLHMERDSRFLYAFRDVDNLVTHLFLDAATSIELHLLIDPDPLMSHCTVEIEPLLTGTEMAGALEGYLGAKILRPDDWKGLEFVRRPIDPDDSYYLARKVVEPFSPLLDVEDQNRIHRNTLISQRAHIDTREVADFNPVGKPVGILIMTATSEDEVRAHVCECEVYVDSAVSIQRLFTLQQADSANERILRQYLRGEFAVATQGDHKSEGTS